MGAPITSTSFAKALWPGVNSWYGKEYAEFPVEYTGLFDTFGSQRAYEEDVGVTSFGLAQVKPEGQAIAYDEETQAYVTRYTHVVYGLGFVITREIYEDDLYDVVGQRRARGLAFSMRQTKETIAANVYNRAFDGSGQLGGDGVEMCHVAHPNFAGGTQSNAAGTPAAFSEVALETAMIQMSKWTDDRGLRINIQPNRLVIPVDQQFVAQRVLGSPYQTGISPGDTSGGGLHEISAIYTMGALPGGFSVNHYLTDTTAWFLRSNMSKDGLKHFERRSQEFGIDNDFETENAKYKATERYSFGWSDWRAIYGNAGA